MNGIDEFNRLFPQYKGVEFTFDGVRYYMHMTNPTKGCAVDVFNGSAWERCVFKFLSLEEMKEAKVFGEKSFIELLTDTENFEDLFYA